MNGKIKTTAISLAATLAVGVCSLGSLAAVAEAPAAPESSDGEAAVYLVPGSYMDADSATVYNKIETGARKLDDTESAAIHTPNAYISTVAVGEKLPVPVTDRENYEFNGWWTIENAQIVYHDVMPKATATTYFYADFRAPLSQPKDPVNPPDDAKEVLKDYMEVTRKKTGKTEIISLYVSATDVSNADDAGYGGPVQFYNEWFYLSPGDTFKVYVSGVFASQVAGPQRAPQLRNGKYGTQLEASGTSSTAAIIEKLNGEENEFRCKAGSEHPYRAYIKFYDAGGTMTIYMERQDK